MNDTLLALIGLGLWIILIYAYYDMIRDWVQSYKRKKVEREKKFVSCSDEEGRGESGVTAEERGAERHE